MSAFLDPGEFPFVPLLERRTAAILAELIGLGSEAFSDSPDSLTTTDGRYDERGWRWYPLHGGAALDHHRSRCPITARAAMAVPGLVNAGFSLFRPGTHLHPHCGELAGVLRCHLPLVVPRGDLGIAAAGEVRRWQAGTCLIFDDTIEHEAWNHGDGDRVLLLITFDRPDR